MAGMGHEGGNAHDRAKARAAGGIEENPPHRTRKEQPTETRPLWSVWELLVVIIGLIASLGITELFPFLYWPGVVLVYAGFAAIAIDGARGKWHKNALVRLFISAVGVLGIAWWSWGAVFVKAPLVVLTERSIGDYPEGTVIGGIKWNSRYSDLRIYLINSSAYEFRNIKLEIAADGMMQQIGQMDPVCQGFEAFPESLPMRVGSTEQPGSKQDDLLPTGSSISNHFRVVCDELPRKSNTDLIVPVMPVDIDLSASNPFPKQFGVPKRLPGACRVTGEYQVLGRTRKVDERCEFSN